MLPFSFHLVIKTRESSGLKFITHFVCYVVAGILNAHAAFVSEKLFKSKLKINALNNTHLCFSFVRGTESIEAAEAAEGKGTDKLKYVFQNFSGIVLSEA